MYDDERNKKPGSRTVTFAKRGLFETDPALEERFSECLKEGRPDAGN